MSKSPGTIGAIIANAAVAAALGAVGVLQAVDWAHVAPAQAVWIGVGLTAANALLHYWTGDKIAALSK